MIGKDKYYKKRKIVNIKSILIFVTIIAAVFIVKEESKQSTIMYGETFCLSGNTEKYFYRNPGKVLQVYGYDKEGNIIYYKDNIDYIVDYNKGTIMRTNNSLIPDYKEHRLIYQDDKKFSFSSEPRNPELNVLFQIKVDYTYEINSKNNKIKDASLYLSEGLKDKIRLKKEINIFVIGDGIAAGAQTTSQYFFNDREKDSFSGYLKETLEDYYKCTINMNNFSGGG